MVTSQSNFVEEYAEYLGESKFRILLGIIAYKLGSYYVSILNDWVGIINLAHDIGN